MDLIVGKVMCSGERSQKLSSVHPIFRINLINKSFHCRIENSSSVILGIYIISLVVLLVEGNEDEDGVESCIIAILSGYNFSV